MMPCFREQIRELRRLAVAEVEKTFKGTFDHGDRQEWGASRFAQGWSDRLVTQAIGGGPFATLHEVIRHGPDVLKDKHLTEREVARIIRATDAFAKIESGLGLETQQPQYGEDVTPLQRRTYAPPRFRLSV